MDYGREFESEKEEGEQPDGVIGEAKHDSDDLRCKFGYLYRVNRSRVVQASPKNYRFEVCRL